MATNGNAVSEGEIPGVASSLIDEQARQSEQEQVVGIAAYASAGETGLRCVFKQRYTDFQVNEILATGDVLHLTDVVGAGSKRERKECRVADREANGHALGQATPGGQAGQKRGLEQEEDTSAKKQKVGGESDEHAKDVQNTEPVSIELSTEDRTTLNSIFGAQTSEEIVKLYSAVLTYPNRKPRDQATVRTEVIESKAERTKAHIAIRTIFHSKLESATLQDEPGRMTVRTASLQTRQPQNAQAGSAQQTGRVSWNELGGDYLHFTLYKENKDTMEVLYFLAAELKIKIAAFSFAGTKDRRGVTVQRVAAHRVHKDRLVRATRLARGWKIGGFEYKKHGLELGELKGNEFVITLRDCRLPGTDNLAAHDKLEKVRAVAVQAASDLGANGYINFYGLQRFGSFTTGTHIVGMKMLQNNLEGAVDSILAYDKALLPSTLDEAARSKLPKDDIDRAEAIRIWQEESDSTRSRQVLPRRFQAEYSLIQYLGSKATGQRRDKDWQGALMTIQRGLRLMYVHAYQSLVWNRAAVKRQQLYGDKVVKGDLVVIGEKEDDHKEPTDKADQDGEVVVHPDQEAGFTRARPLSKEEAENGKWDIFDIVLPLPGWDVLYPANDIGKFYEEFMGSEEGGRLDPHDMRRLWKDISLSGGYRKMMSRPLNGVDVQAHLYTGEQQLAQTDVDRLNKETALDTSKLEAGQSGDQIAIVLKLQLGSSQYATMALRELTRGGAIAYKPDFSTDRQRRG